MRLWLDNTGLHSAGRALDGRAREEIDAQGLLHLITQLVFADELLLSGFEEDEVAERSRSVRNMLLHLGLNAKAVSILNIDSTAYASCCELAARRFVDEFRLGVLPSGDVSTASRPEIPPGANPERAVARLLRPDLSTSELSECTETALSRKAAGAVEYMIAAAPELRQLLVLEGTEDQRIARAGPVAVVLRCYLNEELARLSKATYSPALARAAMADGVRAKFLSSIEHMIRDAGMKLRIRSLVHPKPIGVPQLAGALVKQAKGDIDGLIALVIAAREAAQPLRTHLALTFARLDPDAIEYQELLEKELADLRRSLYRKLRLPEEASAEDSGMKMSVSFMGVGIDTSGGIVRRVIEYLSHLWKRRRLDLLVNLTRVLARTGSNDPSLARFYSACRRMVR